MRRGAEALIALLNGTRIELTFGGFVRIMKNITIKYCFLSRRRPAVRLFAGVVAMTIATQSALSRAQRPIEAIAGIPPTAFLAARIGGERILVRSLLKPGDNPHTFEPTPRQAAALGRAELYFSSGFPFESRFSGNLFSGSAGPAVIRTDAEIPRTGAHDRSGGHRTGQEKEISGHEDPHIWLSPILLRIQAETICGELTRRDPDSGRLYRENLDRFRLELDSLDRRTSRALAPYRGRAFLVYHPSFGLFAEAYGLRQIPIEAEGKSPSPRALAAFVETARRENIRVVFIEPQFESRSAQAVADAIGGRIERMDPMAPDVFETIGSLALALARAFHESDSTAAGGNR
jgi:zinc transport system substrate-binding protein